ncbi:hypothetical protein V8B55DRAFT_1103712, partial [Mucor lusitanicus]
MPDSKVLASWTGAASVSTVIMDSIRIKAVMEMMDFMLIKKRMLKKKRVFLCLISSNCRLLFIRFFG